MMNPTTRKATHHRYKFAFYIFSIPNHFWMERDGSHSSPESVTSKSNTSTSCTTCAATFVNFASAMMIGVLGYRKKPGTGAKKQKRRGDTSIWIDCTLNFAST